MRNRTPQDKLPSFASRDPVAGKGPQPPARAALPKLILEIVHKVLTGGAALATILRLLF